MMCLGVFLLVLLGSNFFGTLWASWTTWKSISFTRLGKFSFIICSNKFSIPCCCSSPSGTPIIQILEHFRLSQRFVRLSSLFWILVCFFILFPLDVYFFHLFQIIALSHGFLPVTVGSWIFCFISSCVSFICFFILQPSSIRSVNILITRALNSPWDRLAMSYSFSSLSKVMLCSFIWAIFLCLGTADKL